MNQKVNIFFKMQTDRSFSRPNKHGTNFKTEKLAQICIILISQCLLHDI